MSIEPEANLGTRWLIIPFGLALVAAPYALTALSSNSICFSDGRIIGAAEKIENSKRWLRSKAHPVANSRSCCEVSKGSNSFVPLGVEAYIASGKAHYVFIPKVANAALVGGLHRVEQWNVVAVDGCGLPLAVGVDL